MINKWQDKIYSILTVSIDPIDTMWQEKLKDVKARYMFLTEGERIVSYVFIGDYRQFSSIDKLKYRAKPIESLGVINEDNATSLRFIFEMMGEDIILVEKENTYIGYMRREDLLIELLKRDDDNANILKVMLTTIPMGVFILNKRREVVQHNETGLRMLKTTREEMMISDSGHFFSKEKVDRVFRTATPLLNQVYATDELGVLFDYCPITDKTGTVIGMMIVVQDLPKVEALTLEMEVVKDINADLRAILSSMYDEILVVDAEGIILRHGDRFISDISSAGLTDLVGESLFKLGPAGEVGASVVNLVNERRTRVSIVKQNNQGNNIIAIGNPMFNKEGKIHRIVIATRDITETTKLKDELDETRRLTKEYKRQIESLQNKMGNDRKLIYCSEKMERVMMQLEKLAEFHSSVLILGESGVGKNLIAELIHEYGRRADRSFLSLNCGAIPHDLLESELFGYVKGAFAGADEGGKIGYFEKVNGGVLFLDEIGELPMHLQVKLLRVLQEKEVTRLGSTKAIPIDVQVITATSKDLNKLVEEGKFREDLFYRINVIPIMIPALRERPEDIPLLSYHFIQKLNEQYQKNYHLSPEALSLLEAYDWPGNIRELQNLIERLVVFADEDVITADFIRPFMRFGIEKQVKPIITNIMPLKKAKDLLEEQLINLAMEKYGTTTKAAEALEINQSTVSRKYQRILKQQAPEKPMQ